MARTATATKTRPGQRISRVAMLAGNPDLRSRAFTLENGRWFARSLSPPGARYPLTLGWDGKSLTCRCVCKGARTSKDGGCSHSDAALTEPAILTWLGNKLGIPSLTDGKGIDAHIAHINRRFPGILHAYPARGDIVSSPSSLALPPRTLAPEPVSSAITELHTNRQARSLLSGSSPEETPAPALPSVHGAGAFLPHTGPDGLLDGRYSDACGCADCCWDRRDQLMDPDDLDELEMVS